MEVAGTKVSGKRHLGIAGGASGTCVSFHLRQVTLLISS